MKKFNPQEISDFARYYGFHYDSVKPQVLVKNILIEMERGLSGQSSSLAMIPSYINPVINIPAGKTVLALDAGGTNLRASLVEFNENGEAAAKKTSKTPMPGTNGYASARLFFDAIADVAIPLLKESKTEGIGFTFSYPMEVTEDSDGILLAFSKEVNAQEVIGKTIGKELRNAMAGKGYKYNGPIVMLNDTVATLLSGISSISPDGEESRTKNNFGAAPGPVIGFILGTGINSAYPETVIPKINYNSPSAPQIIVCETGNYSIPNRGKLDIEYDNSTQTPGSYHLEKAAAGAYLGPLALHIFKQAIRDKVLCFEKSDQLMSMTTLETRFVNEFTHSPLKAEGPLGSLFAKNEADALAAVQYIVSIITERGALVSAALLAATVQRINTSYEPYSPVRIAVEGTTYAIYKGMRRSLDSYLHQMLYKDKPRPYILKTVEQASLFGAAVAALSKGK